MKTIYSFGAVPLLALWMGGGFGIAAATEYNFYLGADAGISRMALDEFDDAFGYQGFLGMTVNEMVGLELGYGSLGEFDLKGDGQNESLELDPVMTAMLAFHGPLPFGKGGKVHLRYGYYEMDAESRSAGGVLPASFSDSDEGFVLGVGFSFPILKPLSGGIDWKFYESVFGEDVRNLSVRLQLDF